MVVKDVMESPFIVAGGGAPETFAATKIRIWAKSLEGREQLAAEKFAEALEAIPLSLSENAGMDPIDTLASLRSKQLNGNKWTGIDVMKGKVIDMKSSNIIEPLAVKHQIISAAAEAACMILRIDDVIATAKSAGHHLEQKVECHLEWAEWVEWVECHLDWACQIWAWSLGLQRFIF